MDEHGEAVFTRGAVTLALAGTTFTVDDVTERDGETVVTTTTAGNFPGSPAVFRWHVTFAGDRIASLRIEL